MTYSNTNPQFEVREIQTKEEYARLVDVLWTANFQPYKYIAFSLPTMPSSSPVSNQAFLNTNPNYDNCGHTARSLQPSTP